MPASVLTSASMVGRDRAAGMLAVTGVRTGTGTGTVTGAGVEDMFVVVSVTPVSLPISVSTSV